MKLRQARRRGRMPSGPSREAGSAGRPCPAGVDAIPRGVQRRPRALTAAPEGGVVVPGTDRGAPACIARQRSRSREAVPYYACPTCVTRQGRRKCARLPRYAGSLARVDPRGARHTPPSSARRENPTRPGTAMESATPAAGQGCPAEPALRRRPARHPCIAYGPGAISSGGRRAQRGPKSVRAGHESSGWTPRRGPPSNPFGGVARQGRNFVHARAYYG
jgi:hypothetical protein